MTARLERRRVYASTRNLVYTLVVMTTLSLSEAKTQLARLLRETDGSASAS